MKLENWLKILNWKQCPNFGKIHNLPTKEEFEKNYYLQSKIEETLDNIVYYLIEKNSFSDKLIVGQPGCGKTTFIYYLKNIKASKISKLEDEYYFGILHFNRLIAKAMTETMASIEERCLEIYRQYLDECNKTTFVNEVMNDKTNDNTKINHFIDFIKTNRSILKKKLIIIIDDIDETCLTNQEIEAVLRRLYTYMETASVEKWLTVRGQTLDYYHESLLTFIRSKFPDKIHFDRVDLNGIIEKRITALGDSVKNPFGTFLCSLIIRAFNEDIREAMGIFKKFLEIVDPKNLQPHLSSEFIQNIFNKSLPTVLVHQKIFPNIYLNSISGIFPLEKDVIRLLAMKHTVDSSFLKTLLNYYSQTIDAIKKKYSGEYFLKKVQPVDISEDDILSVIDFYISHSIVGKIKNQTFSFTQKGRVFSEIINTKIYKEICRKEMDERKEIKSRIFLLLFNIEPRFEDY